MADRLDLRDLRYFEAIAETSHVGRAARALHRSQPTLTGAVRRLEEHLGARLFEKSGRGIRLTAAGESLQARAAALRVAAAEAEREVGDIGRGLAGVVRMGMVPTAARLLMPALLGHLLAGSPRMRFKTVMANNDVLRTALAAGDLDLTVSFTPAGSEDIVAHPIFRDECVVVARRGHPVLKATPTLRRLLAYGWILGMPTVATREWLDQAFRSAGLALPNVQVETSQVLFLPSLLAHSDLLSFMSRRQLEAKGPLREVRLRATTMRRDFSVSYRREGYLSPAARRVIEMLRLDAGRLWNAGARQDAMDD